MTEGSEFKFWQIQQFSFFHVVQTGSEAHTAYYAMDTQGSFLGGKEDEV
jgi:hypothetical protein